MKEFFKKLKAGMMFSGLVSLALGILLVIRPDLLTQALGYVLGVVLLLLGLGQIVLVFVQPNGLFSVGRMIPGILTLAVGFVFLFHFEEMLSLFWVLVGIAILIDSVYKLQYAFELKAGRIRSWWVNLCFALVSLIFALILVIRPAALLPRMATLTGALLAVNGVFDLATVVVMSIHARQLSSLSIVEIRDGEEEGIVEKDRE